VTSCFGWDASCFSGVTSCFGWDASCFSRMASCFGRDTSCFSIVASRFSGVTSCFHRTMSYFPQCIFDPSTNYIKEKTVFPKDGFFFTLVVGFADTFYHPSCHLILVWTCSFSFCLCSSFNLLLLSMSNGEQSYEVINLVVLKPAFVFFTSSTAGKTVFNSCT